MGASAPMLPPTFPSLLGLLVQAIQGPRLENATDKKLFVFCKSVSQETLKKVVDDLLTQDRGIICIGLIVKTLISLYGEENAAIVEKKVLLDMYIKYFLITKVKKSSWALQRSAPVLKYAVDSSAFTATLMPALQKSILRSPEIAMEV